MASDTIIADHFLVVGGNHWAKDSDLTKAFFSWMALSKPSGAVTVHVRNVDGDAYVNELGDLHAKSVVDLPDVQIPAAAIKAFNTAVGEIEDCLQAFKDASLA